MIKKLTSKLLLSAASLSFLAAQGAEARTDGPTNLYPIKTEVDVKTNLLYDLTSTINLGVEMPIARKWSIDLSGNYNPWTMSDNRKWKHWLVQPELRYWTAERQHGHFFGLHLLGGEFNINKVTLPFNIAPDLTNRRYEGWLAGAGLAYGYRWNFSQRWGMEGEIGVGAVYSEWDKYCSVDCGVRRGSGKGVKVAPTKLALNLIYRFGKPGPKRRIVDADYLPVCNSKTDTLYINRTDTVYKQKEVVKTVTPATPANLQAQSLRLVFTNPHASPHVDYSDRRNRDQNQKLEELVSQVCGNNAARVKSIKVSGYSSIDGSYQVNEQLSRKRAQNLADEIISRCPQLASKIRVEGYGEDWDGLYKLLPEMTNDRQREAVERLYETTTVLGGRENALMKLNGGNTYRWLKQNIFPRLRRVEVEVEYETSK